MFTKQDQKFLLDNFVTKSDLVGMEERQNKKFPTKVDLKKALDDQKEEIVDAVGEYIADTIVPMFDQRDKKISRMEKKLNLPTLAD